MSWIMKSKSIVSWLVQSRRYGYLYSHKKVLLFVCVLVFALTNVVLKNKIAVLEREHLINRKCFGGHKLSTQQPLNSSVDLHIQKNSTSWNFNDLSQLPWQPVNWTSIRLYSAYFDNRFEKPFVRILGYQERRHNYSQKLYCWIVFQDGERTCHKISKVTQINKSPLKYTNLEDFYYICELKKEKLPLYVGLTANETDGCTIQENILKVENNFENSPGIFDNFSKEFCVCVEGPVYGRITPRKLIEALEMYRILGAEKVVIYDESISSDIMPILKQYINNGYVELLRWNIKKYKQRGRRIHYFGQSLLINDCLYRLMWETKYVAFLDLDELIIPRSVNTFHDLVQRVSSPGVSGFRFINAFYTASNDSDTRVYKPELLRLTKRGTLHTDMRRSKYIVEANKVEHTGVHFPFIFLKGYTYINVSAEFALLHHLRGNAGKRGNKHVETTDDDIALKYQTRLENAVQSQFQIHNIVPNNQFEVENKTLKL